MNLFDLSLRLQGYPIDEARKELNRLEKQDAKAHKLYVAEKKLEIANYHLKNNPFYAGFTGFKSCENWAELPILTKSDLQQPLEKLLSAGYSKDKIYQGKTSGSSGEPFNFAKDKWCHALTWASFYASYASRDIDLSGDKQARFYGIPLRGKDRYTEKFKDLLGNRYRFPVFDTGSKQMENALKTFKNKPFGYINGYTSSILLFSKFLRDRQLVLKALCPTLKACIVTSEMLYERDRDLMEKQLGVPLINEYGASETGLIAFENEQKQLIIDHKLLFIEIVDEAGNVLPNGEKGQIVITALYNKAQPFIRYAIGDLGILNRDQKTGKLFLKELSGRSNDNVQLPSGKSIPGLAFYYVTKSAMETTSNVKEFVITQTSLSNFEITYVSDRPLDHKEELAVRKAMQDYLEPGLTTSILKVETLQRSKNGKLKQFCSLL
ncbi:phenylacetate--CoA ligase family protein [Flavimarina sp. Hel_I_48]|uniref:phenylacetate--CoA ligase family protein n=1 Tax=Flavimarina sp. Hel_I_48 TaxID=1392488 RepID=UPI0004DF461D|nr:phenylacetate--CoA ligase family protein [Flavimarina sp. Hel_I_48]